MTDLGLPRFVFLTGKGGVGKTSLAAAYALHRAESGKKVLIISTDPASNLDEVFDLTLTPEPQPLPDVPTLFAANLDPEAAAQAYRERMVAPLRGRLPEAVIRKMEEQFSGACTTEIAAFDEFVRYLADPAWSTQFDQIIFDTAPTGHTLRLLALPAAWSGYLSTTTAEDTCLGPLSGLRERQTEYETATQILRDPGQTAVVLVARPDRASLKEADRTRAELHEAGLANLNLILNTVFPAGDTFGDPIAKAMAEDQASALAQFPPALAKLPRFERPLFGGHMVGLDALRRFFSDAPQSQSDISLSYEPGARGDNWSEFTVALAAPGAGVIMTMGKGGVGKTTIAAELALGLAERGHAVTLTTTDPTGHIVDAARSHPNLIVTRIDPAKEVARYRAQVMAKAASHVDADGLALIEEDLRSPCTEEIAVFQAFAATVAQGANRFVVIDTAPTGHTLLLMDATEAYHREVSRTQSDTPEAVRNLMSRLRDPEFTRILLVTLPEPTPVHEAMRLQADLARAGISTFGWVINRSLSQAQVKHPLLVAKAASERAPTQEVLSAQARVVLRSYTPSSGSPAPEPVSL